MSRGKSKGKKKEQKNFERITKSLQIQSQSYTDTLHVPCLVSCLFKQSFSVLPYRTPNMAASRARNKVLDVLKKVACQSTQLSLPGFTGRSEPRWEKLNTPQEYSNQHLQRLTCTHPASAPCHKDPVYHQINFKMLQTAHLYLSLTILLKFLEFNRILVPSVPSWIF